MHFNVAREVLKQEQKKLYNRANRRKFDDLDELEKQIFMDYKLGVKKTHNKKYNDQGKLVVAPEDDHFGEYGYHGEYIKNRVLFDEDILMNNKQEHINLAIHKTKYRGEHGYYKKLDLQEWFNTYD